MRKIMMHDRRLAAAFSVLLMAVTICACGGKKESDDDEENSPQAITPVTITHVETAPVADTISLNATSVFLQKNYVKANAIGYVERVNIKPGQYVQKGQVLFIIKTKEAQSIGNAINALDKSFRFSGVNTIKASAAGYVTQLDHQLGDYVQDGEQLAVISDHNSFAFLLQIPYELHGLIAGNKTLRLDLPDGTRLTGQIASTMPTVDTLAQTQGLVVKVNSPQPLPENLVAKARLVKAAKSQARMLPKSAVLANETLTEYWVMKLINDSTAVKVPVRKGIETAEMTEIISPDFKPADRIVETGNYGLADTAKIKITRP